MKDSQPTMSSVLRRGRDSKDVQPQGKGHVKTQPSSISNTGGSGHVQLKERDLRKTPNCQHLDPGIPASRTGRR